jgi:DNA-binding LacI/PurR family transcriptional regulator
MITIKDMAKQLHLSPSSVSRALNGSSEIGAETKRRVIEFAEASGYFPNRYAQQLVRKNSYTIGFMIPDISDTFFSKSAHGVEKVLQQSGHEISYFSAGRNTDRTCEFLIRAKQYRYNGVFLTPDAWDDKLVRMIESMDIPVVVLRRKTPDTLPQISFVDSDQYGGAILAMRHLMDLGHKAIGFIGMDTLSVMECRKAYRDAVSAAGFRGYESPECHDNDAARRQKIGYEFAKDLLKENRELTAFFAADDYMAIGALEYLSDQHIRVPEEFSVAGFDDRDITSLFCINLTTVHQPLREIGYAAADLMLRLLGDRDAKREAVLIDTSLVVRGTTAARRV